jgi:hypothetical protein
MRRTMISAALVVVALAFQETPPTSRAQALVSAPRAEPVIAPLPARLGAPRAVLEPAPAQPAESDRALPINLATALRLADARPIIIEAARAAVETEYGLYEQARVLVAAKHLPWCRLPAA